jgi:metallo-beta-lactamase class B
LYCAAREVKFTRLKESQLNKSASIVTMFEAMRTSFSTLLLILSCTPILAAAEANPSWTTPIAPFRIADNLYYVGTHDLASYLIVTGKGNILINANLDTSPRQIRASVEKL